MARQFSDWKITRWGLILAKHLSPNSWIFDLDQRLSYLWMKTNFDQNSSIFLQALAGHMERKYQPSSSYPWPKCLTKQETRRKKKTKARKKGWNRLPLTKTSFSLYLRSKFDHNISFFSYLLAEPYGAQNLFILFLKLAEPQEEQNQAS